MKLIAQSALALLICGSGLLILLTVVDQGWNTNRILALCWVAGLILILQWSLKSNNAFLVAFVYYLISVIIKAVIIGGDYAGSGLLHLLFCTVFAAAYLNGLFNQIKKGE